MQSLSLRPFYSPLVISVITLLGRYILISIGKHLLTTTTLLGKNNTIRILTSYTILY